MQFSARQICDLLSGTLIGDPNVTVNRISGIGEAGEGALTFISNAKYEAFAGTTNASIIIIGKKMELPVSVAATLIRVDDAYAAIAKLLQFYAENLQQQARKTGIEQPCYIHPDAQVHSTAYVGAFAYIDAGAVIAENAQIYPHCYVGANASIGKNTTLYAGVKVYADCIIGEDCMLHAGCVIGADGFGFAPQADGSYKKIPQLGKVIIDKHVEIGANVCIDRATFGTTRIEEGVKLDNLIQVAHNVEIGEHTVVAAQTGISGSTKIGKNCMIGGQVGFVGHINIADGSKINAQSGINTNIKEKNKAWMGYPALEYGKFVRSQVHFSQAPPIWKKG